MTSDMLETIRRRLRNLAELIQPKERKVVITDFEDEIGVGQDVTMPDIGSGVDKARFKMKVRRFVDEHRDHITLNKVRLGEQLTKKDLDELGRILIDEGIADDAALDDLANDGGLGRFLRSLTGLDRTAAKGAFGKFTTQHQLNANQTEFLDLIIDSLTESGIVEPQIFYESPFTDLDDMGISGIFDREQAKTIIDIVQTLNQATAA